MNRPNEVSNKPQVKRGIRETKKQKKNIPCLPTGKYGLANSAPSQGIRKKMEHIKKTKEQECLIIMAINRFEAIKAVREDGSEFWMASELGAMLGYTDEKKFQKVVEKAMIRCENAGKDVIRHFGEITVEFVDYPENRILKEYALSRYACHLITQSSNPYYAGVTLGKSYFYLRPEDSEETAAPVIHDEEIKLRLYGRKELKYWNKLMAETARGIGITSNKEFAIFQNCGYYGLYGGLTKIGVSQVKGLGNSISLLDYMGSVEMIINKTRIALTIARLQQQEINSLMEANAVHKAVGSEIRAAIERMDGILPEDLPLAERNIVELEREYLILKKINSDPKPLPDPDREEPEMDED